MKRNNSSGEPSLIQQLADAAGLSPDKYAEKIVRASGNNISIAADNTGIPPSVIGYWLRRGGWKVVQQPILVPIGEAVKAQNA